MSWLGSFSRLAAVGLVFAGSLAGQTTFATITGTVTDPNAAVVPGVTVSATHVQSNYRYTAVSNDVGLYTLSQLREGEYVVRAQASGFKEFVAQDVLLVSRDVRRMDIRLELGTVEAMVEVSAGATLIETETARISDFKGAEALKSLPLNTRSIFSFVQLTPGVARSAHDGTWSIRFAGSRHNQENEAIDGITFNNSYDGTVIGPLADRIESFEEVRVDMANNTAEFGAIGQITIIVQVGKQSASREPFRLLQHTLVPRPQSFRPGARDGCQPRSGRGGGRPDRSAQDLRRGGQELFLLLV